MLRLCNPMYTGREFNYSAYFIIFVSVFLNKFHLSWDFLRFTFFVFIQFIPWRNIQNPWLKIAPQNEKKNSAQSGKQWSNLCFSHMFPRVFFHSVHFAKHVWLNQVASLRCIRIGRPVCLFCVRLHAKLKIYKCEWISQEITTRKMLDEAYR